MKEELDDEMPAEYNLEGRQGIRGRFGKITPENSTVEIIHEDGSVTVRPFMAHGKAIYLSSDVEEYFPDSETVNNTLRALIALFPKTEARKGT